MLTPDLIPSTEPIINVGIILPEDDFTSVVIKTPANKAYLVKLYERSIPIPPEEEIYFHLEKGLIHFRLQGKEYKFEKEVFIFSAKKETELKTGDGIRIKNIVAGRGFHWNKYIDVFLSGSLKIRPYKDRLILINELRLEEYLMCVATSEMGASCPSALIESQTIAARSWLLANIEQKHRNLDMDVCNDDCCQRYQGTGQLTNQSVEGVKNTVGQILMFDDYICDARYSKSCGGVTESFESIWRGEAVPYLTSIIDAETKPADLEGPLTDDHFFQKWVENKPETFCSSLTTPENELGEFLGTVDESGQYFRWNITIPQDEMTSVINRFNPISAKYIMSIKPLKRGYSGRITRLIINYLDQNRQKKALILDSEYLIRQSLYRKFLYSSAFIVTAIEGQTGIPVSFSLQGAGWGHGVGLCQIGALGMALTNHSTEEILSHYYPGALIKRIYE
ncbi:MAG: SpoIID/LytB domain-containing protein [Calditrichaceae bacterium]